MDIDKFISQFLDKKAEDLSKFKDKYPDLGEEKDYSEWESIFEGWSYEESMPDILLSDD